MITYDAICYEASLPCRCCFLPMSVGVMNAIVFLVDDIDDHYWGSRSRSNEVEVIKLRKEVGV